MTRPEPCDIDGIKRELAALGIHVTDSWLRSCVAHSLESGTGFSTAPLREKVNHVASQFLLADVNLCGAGCLPANIQGLHQCHMEGSFLLQVDEMVNMAAPAKDRYKLEGVSHRCLKLNLTDGVQRAYAMEYRKIPSLRPDLPAGFKVRIMNPFMLRGVMVLVPESILPLGGQVAALEAARKRAMAVWEEPVWKRVGVGDGRAIGNLLLQAQSAAWNADGSEPGANMPQHSGAASVINPSPAPPTQPVAPHNTGPQRLTANGIGGRGAPDAGAAAAAAALHAPADALHWHSNGSAGRPGLSPRGVSMPGAAEQPGMGLAAQPLSCSPADAADPNSARLLAAANALHTPPAAAAARGGMHSSGSTAAGTSSAATTPFTSLQPAPQAPPSLTYPRTPPPDNPHLFSQATPLQAAAEAACGGLRLIDRLRCATGTSSPAEQLPAQPSRQAGVIVIDDDGQSSKPPQQLPEAVAQPQPHAAVSLAPAPADAATFPGGALPVTYLADAANRLRRRLVASFPWQFQTLAVVYTIKVRGKEWYAAEAPDGTQQARQQYDLQVALEDGTGSVQARIAHRLVADKLGCGPGELLCRTQTDHRAAATLLHALQEWLKLYYGLVTLQYAAPDDPLPVVERLDPMPIPGEAGWPAF